MRDNLIDCGGRCHFGIELGPHPWFYLAPNIFGPMTITANTVGGAAVLINAYGAGTTAGPFAVYDNTFASPCVSGVDFLCMPVNHTVCSALNIAPDAVIDRRGETTPVATTHSTVFRGCP